MIDSAVEQQPIGRIPLDTQHGLWGIPEMHLAATLPEGFDISDKPNGPPKNTYSLLTLKPHPYRSLSQEEWIPEELTSNRYIVERNYVNRGGYATIYRGFDRKLQQHVAIKVLNWEHGEERKIAELEAKIMAQLDRHPGIVRVHDYLEFEAPDKKTKVPIIIMDWIDEERSPTLAEEKEKRTFTHSEITALVAQLSDTLDYAHKKGIVHCDIKPGNIFLDPHHAKLSDFGNANMVSQQTNTYGCTPHYSSLEIYESTNKVSSQTDVFSLAVVAYHLLTQDYPFAHDNFQEEMRLMKENNFPCVFSSQEKFPDTLTQVLKKAFDPNPQQRYATAGEFAQAFQSALIPKQ